MAIKKPILKTQKQISNGLKTPYLNHGIPPIFNKKARENQKTVKNDNVKKFTIGLQDIDEAVLYYFKNTIQPFVIQNSTKVGVPILYGSSEIWKSVQKDGYYRDVKGKIQLPLIMFKRESIEKNRTLSNKLDANNPNNFGIFTKTYSRKNIYDKFSVLNNRIPVKEYHNVIIPDYVNITYICTIFTEYVSQNNKLVESINFASDSYWGDPERFQFRVMIDSFSTPVELIQGKDRVVKTTFNFNLLGHIIPDITNNKIPQIYKTYNKSSIKFDIETTSNVETLSF